MSIKTINGVGRSGLAIPDTHFPYTHVDWFEFIKAAKQKYCDKRSFYIHLGDEADKHAISFHPSDADLPSAGHELQLAIQKIQQLHSLIPKMDLCESNHGSLHLRRFKFHGIPLHYIKDYKEIYGTPKWNWHHEIILKTKIGDTYICHGKSSGYGKLCKEQGMHAIQGHFHGKFEITWHKSTTIERYNAFVGCLVDWESLAMAYGKNHIPKPILGLMRISKSGYPHLVKMQLNSRGRWDGSLP